MTGWFTQVRRLPATRRFRYWMSAGVACGLTAFIFGLSAITPAADSAGRHGGRRARRPPSSALARTLANEVNRASSPAAEYTAVLKVMRALYIGVYTPSGRVVRRGGETGPQDLYLYTFELRAIADSLLNRDRYTPDNIATLLSSVGITINGGAVPSSLIAALLPQWIRVARSEATKSSSLLPLLVEDLGLGSNPRRDLSRDSDIQLDALQTFLIEADMLGPVLRRASESRRGALHAEGDSGGCPQIGPPSQEEKAGEQINDRMDDAIEKAAKQLGGEEANELVEKISAAKKLASEIEDGIHGSIIGFSLKVDDETKAATDNGRWATAYGPVGNGPLGGQPIDFQVRVYMRDAIGDGKVHCFALSGDVIPPQGPIMNVPVLWNARVLGSLEQHGTFTPAISQLLGTATSLTDKDGLATLVFTPRDEVFPGLGFFKHDDGVISGTALWANATGNKLGKVAQFIAPVYASLPWDVGYHDQAGDLEFDSTMVDTPVGGSGDQVSGSATYHVQSLVHFGGQDPAATTGPLGPVLPASAPLTHVEVSGTLSKAGNEVCLPPTNPPTGGPYSLIETPSDFTDGTLQLLDMNLAPGSNGPSGLMLHILPSPEPLESMNSNFSGSCGDSFDTTFQAPLWESRFFIAHQAEVPSDDNCELEIGGVCSYEMSGFQPGPSGTYATKDYVQHIAEALTCDNPGYSCVVLNLDEHTTISLLQSQ